MNKLTSSQVIDIFKTLDRDGNGELSHAEFLQGVRHVTSLTPPPLSDPPLAPSPQ
jgi:Ca2+-binding EF-hand superfamily protein